MRTKVNRQGKCPYCDCRDFTVITVLRPDRTAAQCTNCSCYSVRHVNGFQYPLEDRLDYTSVPLVVAPYSV